MKRLEQQDKAVLSAIRQELSRQRDKIELIASENFVSRAVMEATGTVLKGVERSAETAIFCK